MKFSSSLVSRLITARLVFSRVVIQDRIKTIAHATGLYEAVEHLYPRPESGKSSAGRQALRISLNGGGGVLLGALAVPGNGRVGPRGAPGRPLPKEDAERIYAGPRTPERGAPTALESFETEFQYLDSGARRSVWSAIRANLH